MSRIVTESFTASTTEPGPKVVMIWFGRTEVLPDVERPYRRRRLVCDGLGRARLEPSEERARESGRRGECYRCALLVRVAVERDAGDGSVDHLARKLDGVVHLLASRQRGSVAENLAVYHIQQMRERRKVQELRAMPKSKS